MPPSYIDFDTLPDAAMVRVNQIVGPVKKASGEDGPKSHEHSAAFSPLVPISHATWWRYVKAGNAPQPIKISAGVTAWRVGDLRAWLAGQQP